MFIYIYIYIDGPLVFKSDQLEMLGIFSFYFRGHSVKYRLMCFLIVVIK